MSTPPPALLQSKSYIFKDVMALFVLLSIVFGAMLGVRPLSNPDEGRYAEIPREMARTGNYITPRINGIKYFEKPPLVYWLTSFSITAFGTSEWSLRLWIMLFSVLGCVITYLATRILYEQRVTAWLAALVLASNLMFFSYSRILSLDTPVSFFMSAAFFGLVVAWFTTSASIKAIALYSAFVAAACATLTKGLIGFILPAAAWVLCVMISRQWQGLKLLFNPLGMLLFALITVPWHYLVARDNPEFLHFYFVNEHFLRYLSTIHARYQPVWFFIPILLLGFFPWVTFLLGALVHGVKSWYRQRSFHTPTSFLLIWALFIFIFFSFSKSKLIAYILPIFPALAVIIAVYIQESLNLDRAATVFERHNLGFIAIALAVIIGLALQVILDEDLDRSALMNYLVLFTAILISGSGAINRLNRKHQFAKGSIALAITSMIALMTLDAATPQIMAANRPSTKEFAQIINRHFREGDEIYSYRCYYQDLPVYCDRLITIVDWTGELEFGYTHEPNAQIIDSSSFWSQVEAKTKLGQRVFIVMRKSALPHLPANHQLYKISENQKDILFSNFNLSVESL